MSTYSDARRAVSVFGGNTRPISVSRPPSMYGGAGGKTVHVSYVAGSKIGCDAVDGVRGYYDFNISDSEKFTMQNLNTRLARYLEKVHSLEKSNLELEKQIREWHSKNAPEARDYSQYEKTIKELQLKISDAVQNKAMMVLQIDNTNLAAEDFRVKLESEEVMRQSIESDIGRLKKVLDDLTLVRSDFEMKIEELKKNLILMKKAHDEEMTALRAEIQSSSVNVEVDAVPQQDLSDTLLKIRQQYEDIIKNYNQEVEAWYQKKYDEVSKQVVQSTQVIQTSRSEVSDLKKTLQTLEIDFQSELKQKQMLETMLEETKFNYSEKLSKLQVQIHRKEEEVSRIRNDIQNHDQEFKLLLDIKARLEMEIAEYRRLLDGGELPTPQKVVVVKHDAVVTRKVLVVTEELVDGKVVSHTEDVDVQFVKK